MFFNSCNYGGNNGGGNNGKYTMRALLPCIVDSCRQCEHITQSFVLTELPIINDECGKFPGIGTVLPVAQCGDLSVEVLNTESSSNDIATTALLSVPIAFLQCNGCGTVPYYTTAVTQIKTFALRGADFSNFELLGSDVQSLTAAITEIDDANCIYRVTVSMIVRIYVAQTIAREVCLPTYGTVNVPTCNNGCLADLQIGTDNATRRGFNTANN